MVCIFKPSNAKLDAHEFFLQWILPTLVFKERMLLNDYVMFWKLDIRMSQSYEKIIHGPAYSLLSNLSNKFIRFLSQSIAPCTCLCMHQYWNQRKISTSHQTRKKVVSHTIKIVLAGNKRRMPPIHSGIFPPSWPPQPHSIFCIENFRHIDKDNKLQFGLMSFKTKHLSLFSYCSRRFDAFLGQHSFNAIYF